jgi:hypothetical protein
VWRSINAARITSAARGPAWRRGVTIEALAIDEHGVYLPLTVEDVECGAKLSRDSREQHAPSSLSGNRTIRPLHTGWNFWTTDGV